MARRTYSIPMTGRVEIAVEEGTVEVEVRLNGLAEDISYDYEAPYSKEEIEADSKLITETLMASPANWSIRKTLYKE